MFPTDDLSLVLAALPTFRIDSLEEYDVAGLMLETLRLHLDKMSPQQIHLAGRLATMAAEYRVDRQERRSYQ